MCLNVNNDDHQYFYSAPGILPTTQFQRKDNDVLSKPQPNSTQPNLNLVGFDTIIAVHTTHPTPPTPPGTLLLLEIQVLVV